MYTFSFTKLEPLFVDVFATGSVPSIAPQCISHQQLRDKVSFTSLGDCRCFLGGNCFKLRYGSVFF